MELIEPHLVHLVKMVFHFHEASINRLFTTAKFKSLSTTDVFHLWPHPNLYPTMPFCSPPEVSPSSPVLLSLVSPLPTISRSRAAAARSQQSQAARWSGVL